MDKISPKNYIILVKSYVLSMNHCNNSRNIIKYNLSDQFTENSYILLFFEELLV